MKKVLRNKKRRNEGREYISTAGKPVPSATVGELCKCPLRCSQLDADEIKRVFNGFSDLINKMLISLAVLRVVVWKGGIRKIPQKISTNTILSFLELKLMEGQWEFVRNHLWASMAFKIIEGELTTL